MIASAGSMFSASLYIGGHGKALSDLADALGVLPSNVLRHAQSDVDFSFYTRCENSIFFSAIHGDFSLACDVGLFHITQNGFHSKLLALSLKGLKIALPDEASESPFDYLIFENGAVGSAVVLHDDGTDTVAICKNADA